MEAEPGKNEIGVMTLPHPFKMERRRMVVCAGATLAEIVAMALPDAEHRRSAWAAVGGARIPPEMWGHVRPRAGQTVTIRATPAGGDGKDNKRLVLTIALIIAANVIAPGVGVGPALARAGIVLAGTLVINELIPLSTPQIEDLSGQGKDSPTMSLSGARNAVRRYGPIPRVLGRHRLTPPLGALVFTEIAGADQYLRMLFLWGYGQLEISDLKIGETALFDNAGVANFDGVEVETLDGGTAPVSFAPGDVDTVGDKINVNAHGLEWGTAISLSTTGALPGGLAATAPVYVVGDNLNDFQLALTPGGPAIDLTSGGSGNHKANPTVALFSNTVFEETLAITLTQAANWQTRTSQPDADELTIDVTFPQGLAEFQDDGTKTNRLVLVEVEIALSGESPPNWSIGAAGSSLGARTQSVPDAPDKLRESGEEDAIEGQRWDRISIDPTSGELTTTKGFRSTLGFGDLIPQNPPEFIRLCRVKSDSVVGGIESLVDERPGGAPFGDPADFAPSIGAGQTVDIGAGVLIFAGLSFTEKRTELIRKTLRFKPPKRGQYDVRVRRVTADQSSSKIIDTVVWTALRTITFEAPIKREGMAMTALRIKATDQLSGVIDNFSGICESMLLDYDASLSPPAWVKRTTRNPASIFREVLQGAANARPLADSRIDLAALETWHGANITGGLEFNMVRDFKSSVRDTLADVAAAGRAVQAKPDGKWSMVRDFAQTVPVQHFTPRNTWGYTSNRRFVRPPHALRIRFADEEADYRQGERLIFDDGFDEATATRIEAVELPGVTNAEQIWKAARYLLAVARLRPETYSFNCDIENLVCIRGDLILLTHDVPRFGLGSGRLKAVADDAGSPPNATGVTTDQLVTMEAGKSYVARFRLADGTTLLKAVDLSVGETGTLTFTTPFPLTAAPAVGDLFMFGEAGSETAELVIKAIEPGTDQSARITAVDAAPLVHGAGATSATFAPGDVDTGTEKITIADNPFFDGHRLNFTSDQSPPDLPGGLVEGTDYFVVGRTGADFQVSATAGGAAVNLTDGGTGTHTAARLAPEFSAPLSALSDLPVPVIESIRSDETVLQRAPDGSWASQILIALALPSDLPVEIAGVQVDYRITGSEATYLRTELQPHNSGEVSVRALEDGESYDLRLRFVTGVGATGAWSAVTAHTVIGKTSPPNDVASLTVTQNGVSIVMAWPSVADLDLAGYEIRFAPQGTGGWEDANLLTDVNRATSHTTVALPPGDWELFIKAIDTSGNKSVNATSAAITIDQVNTIVFSADEAPGWAGTKSNFLIHPPTGKLALDDQQAASGDDFDIFDTYIVNPFATSVYTTPEIVLSVAGRVRIWANITAALHPDEVAGGVVATTEARIDPDGLGFGPWALLTVDTVTAKKAQFRFTLDNTAGEAVVSGFVVTIDEETHVESGKGAVIGAGGTSIVFGAAFFSTPIIKITVRGGTALIGGFDADSATGFDAHVYDTGGTEVGGTIDWEASNA